MRNCIYLSSAIMMAIFSCGASAESESSNIERGGKYINSSYSVESINLTADHNEDNGIPKAFYANGRMQSQLLVDVDIVDSSGQPVVLLPEILYDSIELYYQQGSSAIKIEKQRDCTRSSNCWGVTPLRDETFLHQTPQTLSGEASDLESFPSTKASVNTSHLNLWLTSTEIAEYRKICAKITFNPASTGEEPTVYDSCKFPQNEYAIYQTITPKTYSIDDFKKFSDPGQMEEVSNTSINDIEFHARNYYITPIDSRVSLAYVTKENYNLYDPRDIVFLFNQQTIPTAKVGVQGFIYEPGSRREVAAGWRINNRDYHQLYNINQKPGSVTVTQPLVIGSKSNTIDYKTASVSGSPDSDGSNPYRFFVYDQYGNPARLKITYEKGEAVNSWSLDGW